MQKNKFSIYETIAQTVLSLIISYIIQLIIYPVLGIEVSKQQNLVILLVFFMASLIRGYFVRRFFNKLEKHQSNVNTSND